MAYKLTFSDDARADMDALGSYISNQLQNTSAAANIIRQIKRAVFNLCDFPEMGAPLQSEANIMGYRYLICGNYMVFYHLTDKTVLIDRVLYGRRNYLSLLFDRDMQLEGTDEEQ